MRREEKKNLVLRCLRRTEGKHLLNIRLMEGFEKITGQFNLSILFVVFAVSAAKLSYSRDQQKNGGNEAGEELKIFCDSLIKAKIAA